MPLWRWIAVRDNRVVAVSRPDLEEVRVGSLGTNDLVLEHPDVAAEHCEIRMDQDRVVVQALAESTPVMIRDRLVVSAALEPPCSFCIGPFTLTPDPSDWGKGSPQRPVTAIVDLLVELVHRSYECRDPGELLSSALQAMVGFFDADRGAILKVEPGPRATVWFDHPARSMGGRVPISRTILKRLVNAREPLLAADVGTHPVTRVVASLPHAIQSIVVSPLVERDRVIAAVTLESYSGRRCFREVDRQILERFCGLATRLLLALDERSRLREENERLYQLRRVEASGDQGLGELLGTSAAMKDVAKQIKRVAATDVTTLITGETGTGKELAARAIHRMSSRAGRPFVAINCSAFPEELIERELFGHVRGAYTGATAGGLGRFELAHGGTLFLDEAGDLPPRVQVTLLRVLQERTIERLGEARSRQIDVRVLSATNADLAKRIQAGLFREDLFYRIGVFTLHMPPLRERMSDLSDLVAHHLHILNQTLHRRMRGVSAAAMRVLESHHWPGNVRELRNVLEQAFVREAGDWITPESIRFPLITPGDARSGRSRGPQHTELAPDWSPGSSDAVPPAEEIRRVLAERYGDVPGAARHLGLSRATLYRRLAALGIRPREFRRPGGEHLAPQ